MSRPLRYVLVPLLFSFYLLSCAKAPDPTDADGDGVALEDGDCDDNRGEIWPGADEHCDGVDEDCDGVADNAAIDQKEWWPDRDGDGHGDRNASSTRSCEGQPSTAEIDDDCDDADSTRYPGAYEECGTHIDTNCDGSTPDQDEDHDGYASCQECDDADAEVNPKGQEHCNGEDDDCDGITDEEPDDGTRYYLDVDGDGLGDPNNRVDACDEAPRGYVANRDDCDDTRFDVGAAPTWYRDLDGDGYGDAAATKTSCLQPTDYVEVAEDCDDDREDVHPGADEEPGSGEDTDCSGDYDCWVDVDEDGYGDAATKASADPACEDPGLTSESGDCDDDDPSVSPDAAEGVADSLDSNCDGLEACYQDRDGDAHGDTALVASVDLFCTGSGEAVAADDCNDGSAAVYPGASEATNDGIDSNCSGGETCRADADADGHAADDGTTVESADLDCRDAGETTAATGDDCDDSASDVYLGAPEEVGNDVDEDCDGQWTCFHDEDGDDYGDDDEWDETADGDCTGYGVAEVGGDCDDSFDEANPGLTDETCDGLDNDCDGWADDEDPDDIALDSRSYYVDYDSDGYGDGSASAAGVACVVPAGFSFDHTDCGDTSASVYLGAPEVTANGVDDDCNGKEACYQDNDGDAYGTASLVVSDNLSCTDGGAESARSDDCDDKKASVYPSATETLGDNVDQDCDTHDLCAYDADKDGYGSTSTLVSVGTTCSTAMNEARNITDCNDGSASIYPGATEVTADGVDQDCNGAETCYVDSDADRHGTTTTTATASLTCSGSKESAVADDCDDGDATVYTGAAEVLGDSIDQSCDGHDLCAYDGDLDGYGHATTTVTSTGRSCSPLYHESTNRKDCNDSDATYYPGAPEIVADGIDQSCDGGDVCYADTDSDSYGTTATVTSSDLDCHGYGESTVSTDCNDAQPTIHPSASETLGDDVDQDCDDHDLCAYDADKDTYGHATLTVTSVGATCATASNEAKNQSDCNDTDPAYYPGASEVIADGKDQSCDGGDLCYYDSDHDGYGTTATSGTYTKASSDLDCTDYEESAYNNDCNDGQPTIYPSAAETLGDDVDQDCDNHDLCAYDGDKDTYGHATLTVTSSGSTCKTSSSEAKNRTDCNDGDATYYPGATEVVADGKDQSCDGGDTCYDDVDADGYGTATLRPSSDLDCVDLRESAYSTDCDDAAVATYPGASEVLGDDVDQSCDGHDLCAYDGDKDGYGHATSTTTSTGATCSTAAYEAKNKKDCNDGDATFYPGATEIVADGKDQSCDGGDTCYTDADGDRYGVTTPVSSTDLDCVDAGEASVSTDCDDAAASSYPGATEVLGDSVDQDCDSHDKCAYDADKDGYGHATTTVTSVGATCSTASSEARNQTDCDDAVSTTNPAATESCNHVDDDCDTTVDDGMTKTYYDGDADGRGAGTTYKCASELPATGYTSSYSDDCDDADKYRYPGATELCDLQDNTCKAVWTSSDEAGIITLTTSAGTRSNIPYSAPSSGTTALSFTSAGGTYDLCTGTYYAAITAGSTGTTTIRGQGAVIVDGRDAAQVIVVTSGGSTVKLQNLTLQNGSSTTSGGNVYVTGTSPVSKATLDLNQVTISSGDAGSRGGGAYVGAYGRLTTPTTSAVTTYATFSSNTITSTAGTGGGLAVGANGEVDIASVDFTSNTATGGSGGGLYVAAGGTARLTGGTFLSNESTDGAGIYTAGTTVTTTVTLQDNVAKDQGGGLYNSGSYTDSGSTFYSNDAVYGAGLAYEGAWSGVSGGTNRLTATIVKENAATGDGGGLWIKTSAAAATTLSMVEPQITGNKATSGSGGGAWVGDKVVLSCFSDDKTEASGGLYYGFSANEAAATGGATGGGAYLASGATLKSSGSSASNGCDFVVSSTGDNTPHDIAYTNLTAVNTKSVGNNVTFTCVSSASSPSCP